MKISNLNIQNLSKLISYWKKISNKIELPSSENCITITWEDGKEGAMVALSPYLFDMLKSLNGEHSLKFVAKKENYILTVSLDMQRESMKT